MADNQVWNQIEIDSKVWNRVKRPSWNRVWCQTEGRVKKLALLGHSIGDRLGNPGGQVWDRIIDQAREEHDGR
jgi:hypothetical protein